MVLRRHTQLGTATTWWDRAPGAAGQAGVGLVESIVALALLSTVVLALASGMLSLLGSSRANAEAQRLQAAVTAWTESYKVVPYRDCAVPADYQPAAQAGWVPPVDNGTVTVDGVEYWDPATGGFSPDCGASPTGSADAGAQRLTVTVQRDGQDTVAQMVIRRPVAPTTSTTAPDPPGGGG